MHPLATKLTHALRAGDLPLATIARKITRNAIALGRGSIALRDLDRVGERARSFGSAQIVRRGSIIAGDDLTLGGRFGTVSLTTEAGATLWLGDRVTINYGSFISASCEIVIDDDVMVGPYCVITDADGDRIVSTGRVDHAQPIYVGSRVWLAARVVVRPGAYIGAGAVIAAGSVVEGEIPPNAIASGAPARVLRIHDGDLRTRSDADGGTRPPASGIREDGEAKDALD